jgi:hypothetical protein
MAFRLNMIPVRGRMARGLTRCLFATLLLAGCKTPGADTTGSEHPLTSGVWRGDVTTPGADSFGALFHVTDSDTGPRIRLESLFIQQEFTDVAVSPESLRFSWPLERPRECLLLPTQSRRWEGECRGDGTDPIGLLLIPPTDPHAPIGLARAAYESDIPWIEESVGTLHILVQTGGSAAGHVARLRDSAVEAFDNAFALLDETPPAEPFWTVYVDSRADMQRLVGRPVGGWADPTSRAAANVVTADGRSPDRHEMMHVATGVAWGVPARPWAWISEGLGTYAPGECADAGIQPLAAALLETGEAVPLSRLIHHFFEVGEVGAYLQSASVVGYIREMFGIAALRAIWREGPAAIPVVTGKDLLALELDWRDFVSRFPAATAALEVVNDRGCF